MALKFKSKGIAGDYIKESRRP